MPNPTTLTVKVPEGTEWRKLLNALYVAFPDFYAKAIGVTDYQQPDSTTFVVELADGIGTLNPNVLDPEDAVLVARVLGAVIYKANSELVSWKPRLGLCTATSQPVLCLDFDWRIHSIPSLGLTR